MAQTLVLGLGNSLLSDDSIGLVLVEKLSGQIHHPEIDFKVSEKVGLNLIEDLVGYGRAVIIDSIITGEHAPGEIVEYSLEQIPDNPRLRCPHDADFKSAIELGRKTGLKMPEKISILGIEVLDNLSFNPELSPELCSRLDSLLQSLSRKILADIS